MDPAPWLLVVGLPARRPRPPSGADLGIEPGIEFEATHAVYRVTVWNRGDAAVRDLVITPRVLRGPFSVDDAAKAIPLLKPRAFGTAAFRIVSGGEPGELEVAATVAVPGRGPQGRREIPVSPVRVDLRPPATRPVYVSPAALRELASRSLSTQDTVDLAADAEVAFPDVVAALEQEGLERVEETTRGGGGAYVGRASFHGLDRRRLSHAVRVVASRRGRVSSMRVHVFVQAEESLVGFRWKVLEAVRRALAPPPHQP